MRVLPDTDHLDHVHMRNDSDRIDYDVASQRVEAGTEHLRERGRKIMKRARGT
ncbi:MAG: hypothetical protein H7841_00710 [Magnetospirillum sp. WYHS-4]